MTIEKQNGFTLIEIMIAMMLGIIVIGGALSIYISTIRGSIDITNSARLNYDLDSAMQLMVNDIRRAGFWGGAIAGSDASDNLFTIGSANIQIPSSSCILYSYDADENGSIGTEYFGFKFEDNVLKVLTSSTVKSCAPTETNWSTLTVENKITITNLQFSFSAIAATTGPPATPALTATSQCFNISTGLPFNMPCTAATLVDSNGDSVNDLLTGESAVETRQVNIVLTGQVLNDEDVMKVLTSTVKIRNDRIFTQP